MVVAFLAATSIVLLSILYLSPIFASDVDDKGVYRTDQSRWTSGNAGNAYREGDWVYYTYAINDVTKSTIPTFNVVFNHYHSSSNSIFVDAFANFRYCVNCAELPDGTADGTAGGEPNFLEPLKDTNTWIDFVPDEINYEYDESTHTFSPDLPDDGPGKYHGFYVNGP